MLNRIAERLFEWIVPPERTVVWTTFDEGQYLTAKSKLLAAGIGHRTRISGSARTNKQRESWGGTTASQEYELLVRLEDEGRARQALR